MAERPIEHLLYAASITLAYAGLRLLRDPERARRGNALAAAAAVLALAGTWGAEPRVRPAWAIAGIAFGAGAGAWVLFRVRAIRFPQAISLLNASGGLASAFVGLAAYLEGVAENRALAAAMLAIAGGAATFTGSGIVAARLQGWSAETSRGQIVERWLMALAASAIAVAAGDALLGRGSVPFAWIGFGAAGAWGILFALSIEGSDASIAISLLNALSGFAAALSGFLAGNPALIAIGGLAGSSGAVLTRAMARTAHRPLSAILAGRVRPGWASRTVAREEAPPADLPPIERAVAALERARRVLIVPGHGVSAAKAGREVKAIAELLEAAKKDVSFGIHPLAGRAPGEIDLLLAELGVPREKRLDVDAANRLLPKIDAALVVGACDIVNPAAAEARGTPLYGMAILEVADWARECIVCNLDRNPGYSGVENPLFAMGKTAFLDGDAKETLAELIRRLR